MAKNEKIAFGRLDLMRNDLLPKKKKLELVLLEEVQIPLLAILIGWQLDLTIVLNLLQVYFLEI